MKKNILLIPMILFFRIAFGQNPIEGTYIGLEKICWRNSKKDSCINTLEFDKKSKWYHLCILKIKADSVFLDQKPIKIYKTDTSYSTSDGAFYYYSGALIKRETILEINLTELFCTYCGHLSKKQADETYKRIKRTKQYFGKLTDKGIVINNFLFKKIDKKQSLVSEDHSTYLKND
jgi:hypothetical protein